MSSYLVKIVLIHLETIKDGSSVFDQFPGHLKIFPEQLKRGKFDVMHFC